MASAEKKKRRQNFTSKEVEVLVDAAGEHLEIIQCKLSSSVSISTKAEAWQKVTDRVNAAWPSVKRDREEVKRKWHDLLSDTRKRESKRKREACITGGGTAPKALTEIQEKILQLIPTVMVDGVMGGEESAVPGILSFTTEDAGTGRSSSEPFPVEEIEKPESEPGIRSINILQNTLSVTSTSFSKVRKEKTAHIQEEVNTSRSSAAKASYSEQLLDIERKKLDMLGSLVEIQRAQLAALNKIAANCTCISSHPLDLSPSVSPFIKF